MNPYTYEPFISLKIRLLHFVAVVVAVFFYFVTYSKQIDIIKQKLTFGFRGIVLFYSLLTNGNFSFVPVYNECHGILFIKEKLLIFC